MKFIQALFVTFVLVITTLSAHAELVNINKASASLISKNLKGIGPKKAKAIILYRKKNGPFKKITELLNVKGIGKKILADNKKSILLKPVK